MKLTAILLLLSLTLLGESAATVIDIEGNVFLKRSDTSRYIRVKGDDHLYQGDLLRTGPKGQVKLIFSDDSILFLGSNGKMLISDYHFNHREKKRETAIHLASGRLKAWVSSVLTRKNNFTVQTKTAVIGVRGTQFIVDVSENQETEVGVIEGRVSVKNLLDTTQTEVLLKPNTYTRLLGRGPAMPGMEMTTSHLKRLNHGLEIKKRAIFKPNFKILQRHFKLKTLLKQNDLFSYKKRTYVTEKKGKKLSQTQKVINNPYKQGYLQRPKVKIDINLTLRKKEVQK